MGCWWKVAVQKSHLLARISPVCPSFLWQPPMLQVALPLRHDDFCKPSPIHWRAFCFQNHVVQTNTCQRPKRAYQQVGFPSFMALEL